MKRITLLTVCLLGLVAMSISGKTAEEFFSKKTILTTVENEGAIFVLDSFFTDYTDGAYERTYHYYNEKGKMILTEAHWFDDNGNIEGGVKYVRDYDANSYETLYAVYRWNTSMNDWTTSNKTEREFDEKGNKILEMNASANGTDDWMYNQRSESNYDELNRITSNRKYRWDNSISDWSKSELTEYTYLNDTDKKTIQIISNWDGSDYLLNSKLTYIYDEAKNLLEEVTSVWADNNWFDGSKIVYSDYNEYGDFGKKEELVFNDWSLMDWEVRFSTTYEYIYNEKGEMISSIETDSRGLQYKNEYEYDKFGNLILLALYEKTVNSEDWKGVYYYTYVYNDDNLWINIIAYSWTGSDWEPFRKSDLTYDENKCIDTENECFLYDDEEEWDCYLWNKYYWSSFTITSLDNIAKEKITIYSQDKNIIVLNDKGEDIRVYDMRGSLQKTIIRANSIETIPATTGIYIVRVGDYAKKIIVK